MSDLPQRSAKRLQPPSWRDSRLIVGILLVALAATLGAKFISSNDDRVPMYAAAVNLAEGDQITAASLRVVDVRLADDTSQYLSATAPLSGERYATRDLRAGELVPQSAVGTADQMSVQRVTVPVDTNSAAGLVKGSRVDVFTSLKEPGADNDARPKTTKELEGVGIAEVLSSGGSLGSSSKTSVALYVPKDKVQGFVEALESGANVRLVPISGSLVSGAS